MCSCRWKGRCGSHGPSELLSTRQVRHVLPAPYAPPPPARQAPPPPARYAPPPPRGQRQLPSLPGHRPPPTRSLGGWVGPPPTPPPSTVASIVAPPASRSPLLHPPPPAVAKGRGERAAPVAAEPEHQMAVTARAGVRMGDTGRNRCKVLPARIGAVRCDWERGRSLPANDEVGIRLWPWGVAFPHCSTAAPVREGGPWSPHCCSAATPGVCCIGNGRVAEHGNQRKPGQRRSAGPPPSRCRGGPTHNCGQLPPPPPWRCLRRSVSQTGGVDTPPARLSRPPTCTTHGCQCTPTVTRRGERPGMADPWPGPGTSTGKAAQHTKKTHRARAPTKGLPCQ